MMTPAVALTQFADYFSNMALPYSLLSPLRSNALLMAAAYVLVGCTSPAEQSPENTAALVKEGKVSSTGMEFDLDAAERRKLEQEAAKGNGESAYRLAQYWGLGGGESGLAVDPINEKNEEYWLQIAANAGHGAAKNQLAIVIGRRDCAKARQILTEVVQTSQDPDLRQNAQGWLDSDFLCAGMASAESGSAPKAQ
ncbi:hypothetical protein [Tabrizicola sp.]|jgi:hypothetical protein|uniref:hypothetical protein n=1 Tax=Tabrizicola sp. TaxID=2005166 RepID=UPI0035AEA821